MNPLEAQVGGNHYSKLAIQPLEFSMANGLDACAHTALKYVTRHQDKGGRKDLEKAMHCIEMREVLGTAAHRVDQWTVDAHDYCRANGLEEPETAVIVTLCNWIETGDPLHLHKLKQQLATLTVVRYPKFT